ncbi:TetR/AcrR family transcriptional regulator [Aliikangiella coralliicola]|uniref:TetR family transcriptional regulator n=1 Tax=Aliikangiella coralliicola TaxID=2592383 RepID=A0A545UIT0_9GAMM|nr:TetR family transcriptional regulator [Aliikangiella coralliicola]TQV89333.1 TetR family transcriptional regulator [Aliikangiella coralliicola]
MGRPSNKAERRAEIVQALMQVMAEKGYGGASIQAIAKQAGLTPGLIHYHFKTKQDILLESVTQLSMIMQGRFEFLSEKSESAEERLKAFINARLAKGDGSSEKAVEAWVMISAEAVRQPEVKTVYLEAMKTQKKILKEFLLDYFEKKITGKKLESKVAFVMAFMEGAFTLSISAGEVMPKNWAAVELMSILTRERQLL